MHFNILSKEHNIFRSKAFELGSHRVGL